MLVNSPEAPIQIRVARAIKEADKKLGFELPTGEFAQMLLETLEALKTEHGGVLKGALSPERVKAVGVVSLADLGIAQQPETPIVAMILWNPAGRFMGRPDNPANTHRISLFRTTLPLMHLSPVDREPGRQPWLRGFELPLAEAMIAADRPHYVDPIPERDFFTTIAPDAGVVIRRTLVTKP